MNKSEEKLLTIVVCSNNVENLLSISLPFLTNLTPYGEVLVVLDESIANPPLNLIEDSLLQNIDVKINQGKGLSVLRNYALQYCQTKFILFIDDDVTFEIDSINEIISAFHDNYQIVGLKLVAAKSVDRWFLTQNQYHYLGIHTKRTSNCIWGACMAFDIDSIKKMNLSFNVKLGRQKDLPLSGEDTTFIKLLTTNGHRKKIIESNHAKHFVNDSKLRFHKLIKRVFWQGITEVKRNNVFSSIQKEIGRNFDRFSISNFFIGILWTQIFLYGILYGIVLGITSKNHL